MSSRHTYSHVDCRELGGEGLMEELNKNDRACAQVLAGDDRHASLINFSYPFGGVSLAAKRVVKTRFASARGIRPGVNRGIIDLAQLRANRLYSDTVPLKHVQKLIDEAARKKGWLVLYTHNVSETPCRFGCTPDCFAAVVKAAAHSGCKILNVRNAVGALAAKL
jgi:hypothetical protein